MNFSQSRRSTQATAGPTPRRSGGIDRPTPGQSRQSNATTRNPSGPPTYEAPEFTLNPAGQRALAALIRNHDLRKFAQSLNDAQAQLSTAGAEINERLVLKDQAVEKARQGREKRRQNNEDEEGEENEEDDARVQNLETQLEEMRGKVDGMTKRMEENFRKLVDGKQHVKWMTESVDTAAEDARNNASTQASTQNPTQRTRRTRGTAEDGDEEQEDEEIEDFQPTDPAAGTQPTSAPLKVFQKHMSDTKDRYQAISLNHRYAQDNDYKDFRRSIHDAIHPDDDVQMEPPEKWFNDDGTTALPGHTRRTDSDEDSDDDFQLQRAQISTRCPLTLREFENPITSTVCSHTFETSAIFEMLGRRPTVRCPVGGCTQDLSRANLKVDLVLVRKIKRLQKQKQTQAEASDDEDDDGFGGATQNTSLMIDDDDEDGGGGGFEAPQRSVKKEPKATATQNADPGPSSQPPRGTQVIDLGDEDDDDEMYD